MKTLKVIVAIAVTIALFFLSKYVTQSDQRPKLLNARSGDYELTHESAGFHSGSDTSPLFSVKASGPLSQNSLKAYLVHFVTDPAGIGIPSDTIKTAMTLAEDARDEYEVSLQPLAVGTVIRYYIRLEDGTGNLLGTLPENVQSKGEYLSFRFEGVAPVWLVILVAGFLSAAMFSATLAAISALTMSHRPSVIDALGKESLWTTIFLISGGGVFSAMLSHEVAAATWGGWPFGIANFADTTTELAALGWLILTILLKGSAFGSISRHNLISDSRARIIVLVCYPLTVIAYLASRGLPL